MAFVSQLLRNVRRPAAQTACKETTQSVDMDVEPEWEKHETPTSITHWAYSMRSPPPAPPPDWTRFVCLSDTHSESCEVPPGDVLLHSGDLTRLGRLDDFKATMNWLNSLPHPIKMYVGEFHADDGVMRLRNGAFPS